MDRVSTPPACEHARTAAPRPPVPSGSNLQSEQRVRPPWNGPSATLAYNRPEMHDAPLPDLVLYGRPGCHLCDEARALLVALMGERTGAGLPVPVLVERDIESDAVWHEAYFETIPVVELGDRRLELVTSAVKLRRLLSDVLDA